MLTSMLNSMAHVLSETWSTTRAPQRPRRRRSVRPRRGTDLYEAADGWVFLAAPSDREWAALTAVLEPYGDVAGIAEDDDLASALTEILPARRPGVGALAHGRRCRLRRSASGPSDAVLDGPERLVSRTGHGRRRRPSRDRLDPKLGPLVTFCARAPGWLRAVVAANTRLRCWVSSDIPTRGSTRLRQAGIVGRDARAGQESRTWRSTR